MKLSVQWKLMALFLILVAVMGVSFYGYLHTTLDKHIGAEIEKGLASEAKLARMIAAREIRILHQDAPRVASIIAGEIRSRVTIVSATGEVVGDSEVQPAELPQLENHLERPEIRQAVTEGQGASVRYSATLHAEMLYIACPFASATGERAILRLALPLTALEAAREQLHGLLLVALGAVTSVALVLSYVLSRIASRSVRRIIAVAEKFRAGRFDMRIPVVPHDEFGKLATAMNDMAARIEQELASTAAEKNRLDTILRGMGEGLLVTDAAGAVTHANPAFLAMFSVRERIEGKPLLHITRHPALNDAFKAVAASGDEYQEEISLQAEEQITVLTHWVPLVKDGKMHGVVAVFHDITEIKRLEKIRSDFVANVSHELRTPITVIKGYAETVLDIVPEENEQTSRFVAIIHRHAERLATLVNDLLALSELESRHFILNQVPVPVTTAVEQACSLLDPKAQTKGILLRREFAEPLPEVLADLPRIEQVLINLIDNAVKYSPKEGVITISCRDEGESVRISVADKGVGIPAKDLSRIFERFYRVDEARSREEGGTGLGLAIVKHIVQLHGGTVAVESVPGEGSTFSFTLRKSSQSARQTISDSR